MDKTLRAFNLLMELRDEMLVYYGNAIATSSMGLHGEEAEAHRHYRSSRWKAGILERYIQEKLKEKTDA